MSPTGERAAERLAQLQRLLGFGCWEYSVAAHQDWWSNELYLLLGLEPGATVPGRETVARFVSAEDLARLDAARAAALETGVLEPVVHRWRRPDGAERLIQVAGEVERDADGRPVRLSGITRDVTREVGADATVGLSDGHLPDASRMLQLATAHDGPLDVLISDVVLPDTRGPEVARRILAARPKVKVLYVSGYPRDALGAHGELDAEVEFLPKPYTPATVANAVRALLHG
jgi:CheY-like chemotaxis protein